MTELDKEIQDAFAEEVKGISDRLMPLAEKIRANYMTQPQLFGEFGQIIDGIYGTAATLGYAEISAYCRSIKVITYKCSKSTNVYALGQVKDLVLGAAKFVQMMQAVIAEPEKVKKIQYLMQKDRERAEELTRKLFAG
jgi:hypothetical protein